MKIKLKKEDNVLIIDLEGNIDINASDFVETIGNALAEHSKDILCNFEGVNLVDYVGISIIAVAYKNVLNHKGRMKLYHVPVHVRKLFSVVGMDRVLDIYETKEQALNSFKEERAFSAILKQHLRRRFKRISLRSNIEYKQKYSLEISYYKGKILNLSAIGAFVISQKTFSLGDILSCRIYLLPRPGIIEVDSKVVWVVDKEIQPQEYPGMGLEFQNISFEKQKKIINFVERHLTYTSQE